MRHINEVLEQLILERKKLTPEIADQINKKETTGDDFYNNLLVGEDE